MTLFIHIDPPAFGPLRLGITEAEAKAALSTLGSVEEFDGGGCRIYTDKLSLGFDRPIVTEISGSPRYNRAAFLYRGVSLFQPYKRALEELLGLGLPVLADSLYFHFVLEEPGLFLALHGSDDEVFQGVTLHTQSSMERILETSIGAPWQPFTLDDFDELPYLDWSDSDIGDPSTWAS